jgi:hypothetical protein
MKQFISFASKQFRRYILLNLPFSRGLMPLKAYLQEILLHLNRPELALTLLVLVT